SVSSEKFLTALQNERKPAESAYDRTYGCANKDTSNVRKRGQRNSSRAPDSMSELSTALLFHRRNLRAGGRGWAEHRGCCKPWHWCGAWCNRNSCCCCGSRCRRWSRCFLY